MHFIKILIIKSSEYENVHIQKQTHTHKHLSTKVKTPGGTITNSAGVKTLSTNLRLCNW